MGDMADFIFDRNINYVDYEMLADNEEALLAEELPFSDTSAIEPEADSARFHGHQEGTAV